jgi:hypothetical protein
MNQGLSRGHCGLAYLHASPAAICRIGPCHARATENKRFPDDLHEGRPATVESCTSWR